MQLRGDYNSTSAVNSTAKTVVTITAPPAAAASVSSLLLGSGRPNSVSTLTLASVPPSLLMEASLASGGLKSGSVSAAHTPLAPTAKNASFALTPSTSGPANSMGSGSGSGHHVSFMPLPLPMMGLQRPRDSHNSLSSPIADAGTSSAPSLIEVAVTPPTKSAHAALELRQSVQSQVTTLEDVDDVENSSSNISSRSSSESDSIGLALVQTKPQLECQTGMASSSSSASVK